MTWQILRPYRVSFALLLINSKSSTAPPGAFREIWLLLAGVDMQQNWQNVSEDQEIPFPDVSNASKPEKGPLFMGLWDLP